VIREYANARRVNGGRPMERVSLSGGHFAVVASAGFFAFGFAWLAPL
jgi:hypothetical protein